MLMDGWRVKKMARSYKPSSGRPMRNDLSHGWFGSDNKAYFYGVHCTPGEHGEHRNLMVEFIKKDNNPLVSGLLFINLTVAKQLRDQLNKWIESEEVNDRQIHAG
jgi:hypothetical protein